MSGFAHSVRGGRDATIKPNPGIAEVGFHARKTLWKELFSETGSWTDLLEIPLETTKKAAARKRRQKVFSRLRPGAVFFDMTFLRYVEGAERKALFRSGRGGWLETFTKWQFADRLKEEEEGVNF